MKGNIECKVYYDGPIYIEVFDETWSEGERDALASNDFLDAKRETLRHLTDEYSMHSSSESFFRIDLDDLRIECKKTPRR